MDIEQLADEFIRELRSKTYNVPMASNHLEGDYGTWDDWRTALIEFAKRAASNGRESPDA